jgi:hypothetical protein
MSAYTHFSARINLAGHIFPLYGKIDSDALLVLANSGTTPHGERIAKLAPEVARIRSALEAGSPVSTKSATISPLTAAEYERCH